MVRFPWSQRTDSRQFQRRHLGVEALEPRRLLAASPIISELMAINGSTLADADDDFSDWIEIHNPDSDTVDLDGWYLTDDPDDLQKWQFSGITIAAGAYQVIFASGKDTSDTHTNFQLEKGGEFLALVEPDGVTIAHALTSEFPRHVADVSCGVNEADISEVRYFRTPTPGAANQLFTSAIGITNEPEFSHTSGFYDDALDVEITASEPGATIRYTTDSSKPSVSSPAYTGPITIGGTTVLRAAVFRTDYLTVDDVTRSYIFLDEVLQQTGAGLPQTWGTFERDFPLGTYRTGDDVPANYEMDPEVVNDSRYSDTIKDDLRAIPSLSLVFEPEDIWSTSTGIYSNTTSSGIAWERPVTAELIDTNGNVEFQVDAGARLHGGFGRFASATAKHSIRLLFKGIYGPTKLRYPWFGEAAVDEFDTVVLRAGYNFSWARGERNNTQHGDDNTFVADRWAAVLQDQMGGLAPAGTWVHLYINGLYWGLYNPNERPSAPFQASYQGGSADDYDVLKIGEVIDGDGQAWNALLTEVRRSPINYQAVEQMLDIPGFIDYMILNQFGGNEDWPHNNWYASRKREAGAKWQFHSWDGEFLWRDLGLNRVSAGGDNGPGEIYLELRDVEEFRIAYGDRIHEHFFNDGLLTSAANIARLDAVVAPIDRAVVPESARWGDALFNNIDPPRTRDDHWIPRLDELRTVYFPQRTDIVLDQYRAVDLYPSPPAPEFTINGTNQYGGQIDRGDTLGISSADLVVTQETALVTQGDDALAFVPADDSLETGDGPHWYETDFVPNSWIDGTNGVGFEDSPANLRNLIGTDVSGDWNTHETSVYSRIEFDMDAGFDPTAVEDLRLRMKYDDGFVAYLNGQLVASDAAPSPATWNSNATKERISILAAIFFDFDITEHTSLLQPGKNVLAIQGLNHTDDDGDLLVLPELVITENVSLGKPPIYFTLDGSDPRASDNSPVGTLYTGDVDLSDTTKVKARVFTDGQWSALATATFVVPAGPRNITITEINYHPHDPSPAEIAAIPNVDDAEFAFIEIYNASPSDTVNLLDMQITNGVDFAFGNVSLAPGEYAVVVEDSDAFQLRYGDSIRVLGQWAGALSKDGETVELVDGLGNQISEIAYRDGDPWPRRADGFGATLELLSPAATPLPELGKHYRWQGSSTWGGTPGGPTSDSIGVVVNEVLTRTDSNAGLVDTIELLNTTEQAIDIGGWFLSDSGRNPLKYQIPAGTILESSQYITFDETDFNPTPENPAAKHFGLSGTSGDDVWLVISDGTDAVGEFVDDVHFDAARIAESFGRTPDGRGRLVPQGRNTLGCGNLHARVGPLVITEINFNPGEPSTAALEIDANFVEDDLEFVEIHNPTNVTHQLTDWRLRGGADYDFVGGTPLNAGESVVVISFNPDNPTNADRAAAFRAHYGIGPSVSLVGGYGGQLSDSGEAIRLLRADTPGPDNPLITPRPIEDDVLYDDLAPWATSADGASDSLQRAAPVFMGSVATSWKAGPANPGTVSFVGNVLGDYTGDGQVTSMDIDVALDAAATNTAPTYFDLDTSGTVDENDAQQLIQSVLSTNYGDANLDGVVDATDFNRWNDHKFQDCGTSWSQGDFSGDGMTDGTDFNRWFENRFTGKPVAAASEEVTRNPRAALANRRVAYVDEVLRESSPWIGERDGRAVTVAPPNSKSQEAFFDPEATALNSDVLRYEASRARSRRGTSEEFVRHHDCLTHELVDHLFHHWGGAHAV